MPSFYNEIDPYAAAWLRNLIKAGLIPDGEVSTQSIVDLRPSDLSGFDQCHFFAGIGGWSQALHLAGWAPDRPVWTGSCPCQPFSVAGKGAGTDDPRHLWPHFHRLIAACRPPVVLGEQVAGKAGYGWFDGVRTDLEATGYAGRAVDIPALAVNAPHIRQRLYWVACDMADATSARLQGSSNAGKCATGMGSQQPSGDSCGDHMADAQQHGHGRETSPAHHDRQEGDGPTDQHGGRGGSSVCSHMADADQGGRGRRPRDGDGKRDGQTGERDEDHRQPAGGSEDHLDVADANVSGLRQRHGNNPPAGHGHPAAPEGRSGHWDDYIWAGGSDGKARRIEPCIPLLANGVSNRVGRLRAYGNAIVPPLAAEVVKALMETLDET
jgi:DNA (cytosine-5)-methyltransferase 1